MTTKNVSLRIGVDGKQQVKNDLQDIGKTGNEAGKQVAAGFDSATSAVDKQSAAYARLATAAKQSAEAQRYQSNLAAAMASKQSGGSASDSASVFKAADDLAKRSEALRAQIDPLGAAQLRMNSAVKESADLFAQGALTEAEHTAAVRLARQEYAAAEKALKGFGAASGLSNAQVMSLTAAIRHSIDAMIAGRPPIQALAMEAGNLNFALGGTGLSGVMNLLKSSAAALVTPVALVVEGIAAALGVVVGAGAAYRAFIVDQKNLEASLSGVGRASGATADQMELIAENTAAAAEISIASARSLEEQFARSGKIGVDMFGGLIEIVKRYAATTGEDLDQAGKDLTTAFADPAKGVDLLNQKVGGLDDKTRQYVLTLAAQGDRQGAQQALLKALIPQLDEASAHTTALGRTWDGVWAAAGRAYENIKKAIGASIDGPTLANQISDLQKERADAQRGIGKQVNIGTTAVFEAPRALKDIDADIAAAQGKLDKFGKTAKDTAAAVEADAKSIAVGSLARSVAGFSGLDELKNQSEALNQAMKDPAVAKRVADLQQVKDAQNAYTQAITTFLTPQEKAQQLAALELKALEDKTPAQKAATAAERERIEIAGKVMTSAQAQADIEAARIKALRTASKEEQNHAAAIARESAALDADAAASLRTAEAYLQSAAAGAKMDAVRRAMVDSARKGSDADERARQILADQIAQEAEQGGKQVAQIEEQVAAQKKLNDQVANGSLTVDQARQQMQIEQTLRPFVIAQTVAEGEAKETLTKIIERLRDAMKGANAEDARAAGQEYLQGQKDALDLAQRELDLQGLGDSARQLEIVRLQTIQQLKRMNIDAESEEGKAILANAGHLEAVNQQLDMARASRQEIVGMFDDISNKFTDFITSGKADWKSFGDMATDVLKDIAQEMIKLSLINPLKNSLFGTNDPTSSSVGGIFGKLLGGLFGGGGAGDWASYAGDFSEFTMGIGHTGAMIGSSLMTSRSMPTGMLGALPRKHGGGMLGPDEIPFVGLTGERVLNRQETKAYNRSQAQPARIDVVVSVATDGKSDAQADAKVSNNGGFDLAALVDNATAKNLGNPNSQTARTLRARFGTSERRVAR